MLGVSRQRVHQLLRAYDDFPTPVAELAVGRIWSQSDVDGWIALHPRRTGRPPQGTTTLAAESEGNRPPSGGTGGSGGAPDRRSGSGNGAA